MEQAVWAPADRVVARAGEQASVGQVPRRYGSRNQARGGGPGRDCEEVT